MVVEPVLFILVLAGVALVLFILVLAGGALELVLADEFVVEFVVAFVVVFVVGFVVVFIVWFALALVLEGVVFVAFDTVAAPMMSGTATYRMILRMMITMAIFNLTLRQYMIRARSVDC